MNSAGQHAVTEQSGRTSRRVHQGSRHPIGNVGQQGREQVGRESPDPVETPERQIVTVSPDGT